MVYRYATQLLTSLLCLSLPTAQGSEERLRFITTQLPPYSYEQQGFVSGYAVELVRSIMAQHGGPVEILLMPSRRAHIEAESATYTGLFSVTDSPYRRSKFLYSEPLFYETAVFYKRASSAIQWNDYKDLAGLRIGSGADYYYGEFFESIIRDNELNTDRLAAEEPELRQLRRLQKGRLDLVICPIRTCTYLKRHYAPEFDDLTAIDKPVAPRVGLHLALHRDYPGAKELLDHFNRALREWQKDGRLQALKRRFRID